MRAHVFQLTSYFLTFLLDLSENAGLGSLKRDVLCTCKLLLRPCQPVLLPFLDPSHRREQTAERKLAAEVTVSTSFEKLEQFYTYFH